MTRLARAQIRVAIRYDDFSNGSPDDLDRFLIETAESSGVPLTIAAVPFGWGPTESWLISSQWRAEDATDLRAEKAVLLAPALSSGAVELAQHGLDHAVQGEDARGRHAELVGPAGRQRDRITRGVEILQSVTGVRPTTFVPPWNRFDDGTVAALDELRFTVLSAGRDAPPNGRRDGSALAFIPATSTPHDLEAEVRAAREAAEPRLIVGLLHPYDFVEVGRPWGRLQRRQWSDMMNWLAGLEDVDTVTLSGLASAEGALGTDRLGAFDRYHRGFVRRLVPPSRPGSLDRPLGWYPTERTTRVLSRHRLIEAVVLWAVVLGLSGAAGYALSGALAGLPNGRTAARVALTAAWPLLALRARAAGGPYFRGLLIVLGLGAFTLGAWIG